MKRVSHIVQPPTRLRLKVNEKPCVVMLNLLTSYSSPALASRFSSASAQGKAPKTSQTLLITHK